MTNERQWSSEQQAIFEWFERKTSRANNLTIVARAGTGKTTTILEGVRRAPERSVLLTAFNKTIADELTARLAGRPGATARTLHSIGWACVMAYRERLRLNQGPGEPSRAERLASLACRPTDPDAGRALVAKLCTKGREIAPHASRLGDLTDILFAHDCVPDLELAESGYDVRWVEERALEAMEIAADVRAGDLCDFADQIFLPVRNGWVIKRADLVVVDEAQDMTPAQLELALGVLRPNGRVCVVGDDRQAIYAFRGADSGSLSRLTVQLGSETLGLKTTYRCAQSIVDAARELVPDFVAAESNPEGVVRTATLAELVESAAPGDFVLSRTNAPLVAVAVKLLRSGKRARVAGKDIGKGLAALVRKMRSRTVVELRSRLQSWADRETAALMAERDAAKHASRKAAIDDRISHVNDTCGMLVELSDGAETTADVLARIDALFEDKGDKWAGVVVCSSVHKAKGLEASRCWLLSKTFRAGDEEDNIRYVAITRAKNELVLVSE